MDKNWGFWMSSTNPNSHRLTDHDKCVVESFNHIICHQNATAALLEQLLEYHQANDTDQNTQADMASVFTVLQYIATANDSSKSALYVFGQKWKHNADYIMYSSFLTASPGSVLFSRSNLLKRKDLCFSCLRLGLIRHRRSLRSSHLSSQVLHDLHRVTLEKQGFPFPGTRGQHTWGSRATKRSWAHVEEGDALDLAMQAVYSFCPLRKEHWSALRRSWDCGNFHDGDSCGWSMPTISASTLRAGGSRGRSHLLLMHLLFGLGSPDSAAFTPVGLVRHSRLGNELSAIALVDTCFTVGVDLALVVVVDAGTCSHAFVVGVVRARESTVELKLHGISTFEVRSRIPGIWHRRCQVFSTYASCRPALRGGKCRNTSPPRQCSEGSSMESRWSSKRVFPLRRNLRRRNSSIRKMWILPSRIFSRADASGRIKTLLREATSSSPDQGFTLLRARASNASSMPSTASTTQRSSVRQPTRIFACSSRSSDPKTGC
jgi:hypothetical protein